MINSFIYDGDDKIHHFFKLVFNEEPYIYIRVQKYPGAGWGLSLLAAVALECKKRNLNIPKNIAAVYLISEKEYVGNPSLWISKWEKISSQYYPEINFQQYVNCIYNSLKIQKRLQQTNRLTI